MPARYFLRCSNCGAPAADTVRICPFCGHATGFDGGHGGGRATADGGYVIGAGEGLVIGGTSDELRECPFCGDRTRASDRHCRSCGEKILIEQMIFATLTIKGGGSMKIGSGGKVRVLGRSKQAIHEAARKNDVAGIKSAIREGFDPDFPDEHEARPLHYATQARALDALRCLVSVGADVDAADDHGQRPLHLAAAHGDAATASLLVSVGARTDLRDGRNQTPADVAEAHRHADLAARLR